MGRMWSNAFTVAIFLTVALVVVVASAKNQLSRPGPLASETTVNIAPGTSLRRIAEQMESEGVVGSGFLFAAAARWEGVAGDIKAGEYKIPAGASIMDVLERVSEGRSVQHRVTVPEGLTVKQVLAIVNAHPLLTGAIDPIPAEGSLAPDTYFVQRGDTRQAVIDRMLEAQTKQLDALWSRRSPDLPYDTPEEALILASIVEKETGLAGERAQVASVFVNRLRKGMRLQSDPTVIYGVNDGAGPLGRPISRTDLRTPTPYNTYTIDRLPPTPIANPGRASIAAVMNPADTDYIFFVADCAKAGGHDFSKTLNEHNRKVRAWRRCEAERRAAEQAN